MAKEKKSYEYSGHLFVDNGHGDLYNAEVDKFLIFRPYPMMVQTIMHKDGSITMNQEKFKENTDKNKGVYESGYEINDDGSVFVKEEDVDKEIKEESEDNKNTSEGQEVQNRFEKEVSTDIDSLGEGKADYEGDEFDQEHDEEWYEKMNKTEPESYEEEVSFDEIEYQMSSAETYDDLYEAANLIADPKLRSEVEDMINTCKKDGDDVDTAYSITTTEYIDPHRNDENIVFNEEEEHFAGEELYSDDPNRYGDLSEYNEKMNPSNREYRFDFGFKNGASLRDDAFDDAKAYLEEEDMAQYLDEPLKSKIDSLKWVLDDVDAVHVEVKTNSPLNDEEMKKLKSEIEGQNSDGLGEGFEQQDFAESYYDPETGDGPYTQSEVLDIVRENYDNMDFWEYRDYIDYDDIREGLENYLHDGNYNYSFEDFLVENHDWEEEGYESEGEFRDYLEQTPEGQLFEEYNDTYDAWVDSEEDDFLNSGYAEDYISSTAIDNAKDMVAKDDYRFNENLWDGGMTSMEWEIPDGVDVTPKSETVIEDVNKLSNSSKENSVKGQVISDRYIDVDESINRAIENNPNGRTIENIKTGERFYEVGNGQWRSYDTGYDYYIDDNSANIDNPKYKDISTGKLLTNDNKPYNENYSKHFISGNNILNGVVTDRAGNIIEYNRYDSNIENLSDDYNYEDSTSDHRTGFGITFSKSEDYIKDKPSNQILKSSISTKRGLLDGDSNTNIVLTDQTNKINNLFQNQISDLPLFVKGRIYSESEVVDMVNTGAQLIANKEGNKAGNDFYKAAYDILEKDGYIKGDIISVNSINNIDKLNRR